MILRIFKSFSNVWTTFIFTGKNTNGNHHPQIILHKNLRPCQKLFPNFHRKLIKTWNLWHHSRINPIKRRQKLFDRCLTPLSSQNVFRVVVSYFAIESSTLRLPSKNKRSVLMKVPSTTLQHIPGSSIIFQLINFLRRFTHQVRDRYSLMQFCVMGGRNVWSQS